MSAFTRLKPHLCKTYQCSFIIMESFIGRKFKRSTLGLWIIAAAFGITMQKAQACNMNVTAVNFGSYDVFSNAASDSTSNIGVNCPSGFGYRIGLSAGSGTNEQRGMSNGLNTLNYNLYTAANRALVWGNATNDSATVSGIGTGQSVNHVVYGRIPPNQNLPAGNYSDTITVMITF